MITATPGLYTTWQSATISCKVTDEIYTAWSTFSQQTALDHSALIIQVAGILLELTLPLTMQGDCMDPCFCLSCKL